MNDEYLVEKMIARIDGQQGWRVYKYKAGDASEEGFYDNIAAVPGDKRRRGAKELQRKSKLLRVILMEF